MEAARRLLSRAVELDRSGRRTEAVICYQESIQLLLDTAKGKRIIAWLKLLLKVNWNVATATSDSKLGAACRDKVRECLDRAEKLHEQIQREKRAGKYHEVSNEWHS